METDIYISTLQRYWGYSDFRGIQRDIIESIGSGRDTLGLMPTGGGKSITFQVPALALNKGVCIVITPLIALMKDQVRNLRERGIKAAAIYSGLTHEEIVITLENCIFGDYRFLYISPERISSELFQTKLRHMPVSFITVDEAHCISQWGYDFRPSYLKIAEIRRILPQVPILALTATATPEVVEDIQKQLLFNTPNAFRMSFERKNLTYVVRHTEDKHSELLRILNALSGSAIVYTRSRKGTREIAAELVASGISATFYHAGLDNDEKDKRQALWQKGDIRVMVATNAFGMGIDKPDVRVVVHMELPDAPEAYFQEAGRAGRDGKNAYAVLLYHKSDHTKLMRRVADTFPDKEFIRTVYEHLAYFFQLAMGDGHNVTYEFNLEEFCHNFHHFPIPVDSALRILSRAGYIDYTEEQETNSRLMFLLRRDELYRLEEVDASTDKVLQWVLRSYTGVFADYVFIDESLLARKTGLNPQQVYESLRGLTRRRILHYIPRKCTPYITYTCKRVETERIHISTEVYEKRKQSYQTRIEAMLHYATKDEQCRSRMLLNYFGETECVPCGRCDICLKEHESGLRKGEFERIRTYILHTLNKQGGSTPVHTLRTEQFAHEKMQIALQHLIHEEELFLNDGILSSK